MLSVREIGSEAALETLASTWNRLLNQTSHPSLYLTYEWITTWWRCHQGPGRVLRVLVVSDGDAPVAIAPLVGVRRTFSGIPCDALELLSMAAYPDHPTACAGRLDVIAPARQEEVAQ